MKTHNSTALSGMVLVLSLQFFSCKQNDANANAPTPTNTPAPTPAPTAPVAPPPPTAPVPTPPVEQGAPPSWPEGVPLVTGEVRRSEGFGRMWRLEYPDTMPAVEARLRTAITGSGWSIFQERRSNGSKTLYVCRGREVKMFNLSATGEGFGPPIGPGASSMISSGSAYVSPRGGCPAPR